jgi:DNA N-6-adenine-methyltransferase (Dam)
MIPHLRAKSENWRWLTPEEIFIALRRGGIEIFDLDVCHPGRDNPYCVVPARQIYTEADDGLSQPWHGLVFLNPPYAYPHRRAHVEWLKRLITHGAGVAVVNALTSSDWWHETVVPNFPVIVFPDGKTKFVNPDNGRRGGQPANGVALMAVGEIACEALKNCGLGWVVINHVARPAQRERV